MVCMHIYHQHMMCKEGEEREWGWCWGLRRRLLITAARCAESPEPMHILTDNGMLVRSPNRK